MTAKSPAEVRSVVRDTARRFRVKTDGECSVYVLITKEGFASFGAYVGQTAKDPEERFGEHVLGYKAGRHKEVIDRVRTGMGHLQWISRAEAESIEPRLAEALRKAGLHVRGGH